MTAPKATASALNPPVGRQAVICMNTWAGRIESPCRVIGETPMRWRVAVDEETRLPGRVLKPGTLALIPKWSVRFLPPNDGVSGGEPKAKPSRLSP